jgi:hypothetical protein
MIELLRGLWLVAGGNVGATTCFLFALRVVELLKTREDLYK